MSVKATTYLYWKLNLEWYDYDENEHEYLTDKAPKEARESFEKYLALRQREKETGIKILDLFDNLVKADEKYYT